MPPAPDVAVVGAGIVGLAVADALARAGADVVVLDRGEPGAGQSAGAARGFRHLHATPAMIAEAIAARAGWDEWSRRAGEPLVGEEGALRLGGDPAGDAIRLRAAGVEAEAIPVAGARHPALAPDAGPLLWDPRGGAIRAESAVRFLARELGGRIRRGEVRAVRAQGPGPVRLDTADGEVLAGRVMLCAGDGLAGLRPGPVPFRRVVHLRVTFAMPGAAGWIGATWADRSGLFGARTYGVADGPGRFALGLAEPDAQPGVDPRDRAADPAAWDLEGVRARLLAYARSAFPGLGAPVDEVVRVLTIMPGADEDRYVVDPGDRIGVVMGHNLFKLAPLLGERVAAAVASGGAPRRPSPRAVATPPPAT